MRMERVANGGPERDPLVDVVAVAIFKVQREAGDVEAAACGDHLLGEGLFASHRGVDGGGVGVDLQHHAIGVRTAGPGSPSAKQHKAQVVMFTDMWTVRPAEIQRW